MSEFEMVLLQQPQLWASLSHQLDRLLFLCGEKLWIEKSLREWHV